MGVRITIRDVDEEVREKLAARARRDRKSMQEYLRGKLERLAQRPSMTEWLESVRQRKRLSARRISPAEILKHRSADHR